MTRISLISFGASPEDNKSGPLPQGCAKGITEGRAFFRIQDTKSVETGKYFRCQNIHSPRQNEIRGIERDQITSDPERIG